MRDLRRDRVILKQEKLADQFHATRQEKKTKKKERQESTKMHGKGRYTSTGDIGASELISTHEDPGGRGGRPELKRFLALSSFSSIASFVTPPLRVEKNRWGLLKERDLYRRIARPARSSGGEGVGGDAGRGEDDAYRGK